MIIPIKLTWVISALRHQVSELIAPTDRVPASKRAEYALKAIDQLESWTNVMAGEPAPMLKDTMFRITWKTGGSKIVYHRSAMREIFEQGWGDKVESIKRSGYDWQHSTVEEMLEYCNQDVADQNKVSL